MFTATIYEEDIMKSILSTCVLFLVLAWKLSDGTTIRPIGTRHETTPRVAEYILFSATITEEPLKPLSNGLEKSTSKYQETTPSGEKPIFLSTKNIKDPLKPSGGTTHSLSSTGLDNASTRGDEPTTFFMINQEEHTAEKSKNVLSLSPQTTTMTSMSHTEHLATAKTMSRGESRSDSLQSSSPLTELTQQETDLITLTTQNMLKEVMTTRDERLDLHYFKSTNKGLERHTQRKRTTRTADEESFKTKTAITSNFQKPPEVITDQTVQTTETLTTTRSSLPWELDSSHQPTLNITISNETSNEERNDTATYPLNTSTTTRFSTGLGPTVNTEVATTVTTETMEAKETYEIPTKAITRKEMNPTSNSKTSFTIFRDTTKSTKSTTIKDNNKNSYPGSIVASLIGSIIFLMFIAFVVVWVRNNQKKKKQMDNPDWAGPSPFIEADINPNLPTVSEDGPFQRHESKMISLHSFLPQQLSKRLSMLSQVDEEVPLGSRTFGQYNAQPLNGNASADQIQTPEANSPPAELSSNSDVPEKANIPQAPENKETVQTNTKPDYEITPSPSTETNSDTSTPFEDVALNPSMEQNTETTSPSDDTNLPSPAPITTS